MFVPRNNRFPLIGNSDRGNWLVDLLDDIRQRRMDCAPNFVCIVFDPAWLWVLEQYPGVAIGVAPTGQVVQRADWVNVEVVANTERWMQRLLVRLGARAIVVTPVDWQQLGPDTARTILSRYGSKKG